MVLKQKPVGINSYNINYKVLKEQINGIGKRMSGYGRREKGNMGS